ncbi:MAG: GNAT family N-acetyltransferase [Phycisphaerales bacterium]
MGHVDPKPCTTADGIPFWVRAAAPDDAPAMRRLERHMFESNPFKVTEPGENDRDEPAEREWTAQHAANPSWLMLLAADSPEPGAGGGEAFARLSFRSGNRRKLAHHGTFGIAVHQRWRARGLGTALITTLLDWAAAHPTLEKVCLGVFAANTGARRLYRRLGFTIEGRSPRHFKLEAGRFDDDITMSIFVKPGLAPERFRTWPRCGEVKR